MIGPIVTICAISSASAIFPNIDNIPFQNINCLTFLEIFPTNVDIGLKASITFIIPPKAATHIIITTTHAPASAKPFITRSFR